jgi:transposase-like protein
LNIDGWNGIISVSNIREEMPMKCPFCKSENTERISGSTVLTKRIPEKISKQGNVTCTESAHIMSIETQRYICLDCGFVFEKLSESDLKRYKEA